METEACSVFTQLVLIFCVLFSILGALCIIGGLMNGVSIVLYFRVIILRYRIKKLRVKKALAVSVPPRATFFGRTKGKHFLVEGPYEDKYLSLWKRKLWKRKRSKAAKSNDKKHENR